MAWREPLFLTNDDGIEAAGLHQLIRILHQRGHPLAVLAPAQQQSASGMRLSLKPIWSSSNVTICLQL